MDNFINKQRCLGLDNSRYSTGWAIIDIDTDTNVNTDIDIDADTDNTSYIEGMQIVDYGYIDTSKIKEEGKTLIFLEEQFTNIIEKYNPDIIIAEQQFVGKNAQTGLVLAGINM